MKHLDVFAGIGGFSLAAEWAGIETIGFVEIDDYCRRVLEKRFPHVPLLAKDIHDYDATTLRGSVDVVTGGFPCQPFSVAGLRRGNEDDRAIWPQMLRVVTQCRPSWVVAENVTGLIDLALDDVCLSLEGEGYEARTVAFPACAVGAWHIRQRVFIVAHDPDADGSACGGGRERKRGGALHRGHQASKWRAYPSSSERLREALPDSYCERREQLHAPEIASGAQLPDWRVDARGSQWESEPAVGRVVDGLSRGLDIRPRLKALGNAVVPQQVYPILAAIAAQEQIWE